MKSRWVRFKFWLADHLLFNPQPREEPNQKTLVRVEHNLDDIYVQIFAYRLGEDTAEQGQPIFPGFSLIDANTIDVDVWVPMRLIVTGGRVEDLRYVTDLEPPR